MEANPRHAKMQIVDKKDGGYNFYGGTVNQKDNLGRYGNFGNY